VYVCILRAAGLYERHARKERSGMYVSMYVCISCVIYSCMSVYVCILRAAVCGERHA
jgi:hypothetical protein